MRKGRILSLIADTVFPPRCVFCGEVVSAGKDLCPKCEKGNPRIHAKKWIFIPEMGQTIQCVVPYAYDGKVRQAIIDFKFYNHRDYAGFFGRQIADELSSPAAEFDFITSVPISAERKRLRGYNQSELIAEAAANRLNLAYRETLIKVKDNREQHKLKEKERKKNVRGIYRTILQEDIAGKKILLIDDIVTTGATLAECAGTLLQAGADYVLCAAVAEVELS